MTIDPIQQSDLDAYVDHQLDAGHCAAVEAYLSKNPAAAAQVMADLSLRRELQMAFPEYPAVGRPQTREAARQLEGALSQRRYLAGLQKIAAVGLLLTTGWIAHVAIGPFSATEVNASVPPPAYVEEAVRAHQTATLRETMASQTEVSAYDPEDIRSATAIVMPQLPADWTVADAQVFPSNFGPSVELAIQTSDGAKISLYAVRPGFFAVEPVADLTRSETETGTETEAAYWQIGEVAYALVSSTKNSRLAGEARLLAKTLY
jgi:anti-sigma factor RsiW